MQHEALNAPQDLDTLPGCNKKKRKVEVAHPRKIFALEDVHAIARRLHGNDTGNLPSLMQQPVQANQFFSLLHSDSVCMAGYEWYTGFPMLPLQSGRLVLSVNKHGFCVQPSCEAS